MQISVAPGLDPIVRLGALLLAGAQNLTADPRLDAPLLAAENAARAHPPADPRAVRTMYRQVGIDPTKTRPSSEALLRRVRKGDPLPRINTLVDVCNWCSLEFQLPYGLYDRAALDPPIVLRLGEDGEAYAGIRKDTVNVGGRLTLADRRGPFGNPTSDSARTMVTEATTDVLAVVFAPAAIPRAELDAVLETTSRRLLEFAGGQELLRAVI